MFLAQMRVIGNTNVAATRTSLVTLTAGVIRDWQ
jgi:hypothetical protein